MSQGFQTVVTEWNEACSSLGAWEAQQLASGDFDSAKTQHLVLLNKLMVWGKLLQHVTSDPGFPDPNLRGVIKLRLLHLEDKRALWHSEMSVAEEDRILKAAFE